MRKNIYSNRRFLYRAGRLQHRPTTPRASAGNKNITTLTDLGSKAACRTSLRQTRFTEGFLTPLQILDDSRIDTLAKALVMYWAEQGALPNA
jgi:hypothetical protein